MLREPHGPGRRIDSGIALDQEVTPYYDPMLAKLISYGVTRQEALRRMQALLCDYTILGVTTNRQFLLDVITSAAFAAGATDTAFLERHFATWQPMVTVSDEILALAALSELLQRPGQLRGTPATTTAALDTAWTTPWHHYDSWRIGGRP